MLDWEEGGVWWGLFGVFFSGNSENVGSKEEKLVLPLETSCLSAS